MSIFSSLLNTLRLGGPNRQRESPTEIGPLADREFFVPNMVCEGCAEKIVTALKSVPGVRAVRPKVPQKRIRVSYESAKVQEQQLEDAVTNIGFTVRDA